MLNILEMTLPELTQWVTGDLGLPKFRAQQIWQWVWQRMARSFDEMTNISKPVREELSKKAQIVWPEVTKFRPVPTAPPNSCFALVMENAWKPFSFPPHRVKATSAGHNAFPLRWAVPCTARSAAREPWD